MNVFKAKRRTLLLFCVYAISYAGVPAMALTGSLLFMAASSGDLSSVQQLAGGQCKDVNWQGGGLSLMDNDGWTPLMAAAGGNHSKVVDFLLSCKADLNLRANDGQTALIVAASISSLSIFNSILSAKPNLDIQQTGGEGAAVAGATALIMASVRNTPQFISALVEAGAQTDIQEDSGNTALHFAAAMNKKENVETLLKSGIDITIENNNGMTAAELARRKGLGDIGYLIDGKVASSAKIATANTIIIATATTATTAIALLMQLY